MRAETETGKPSGGAVAGQAIKVANLLTTRHTTKKHGGYNIYQDERISITLDTYVPNLDIRIIGENGKPVTVFGTPYHSLSKPNIFRPGRWTQHLEGLYRKALEVEREQDTRKEQEKAENLKRRYGPVDDAKIFADIPETQPDRPDRKPQEARSARAGEDMNYNSDRPLRVLSLGAGVQSTCLALMADTGVIEPPPNLAIFADTGWEPPHIYSHLDWLEKTLTLFPIQRIQARDLAADVAAVRQFDQKAGRVSIPLYVIAPDGSRGITQRQCTIQYKINAIHKAIREHLGLKSLRRPRSVEMWLGITIDEAHRMRDAREKWAVNRYPLVNRRMRRSDCLAWLASHYPGLRSRKSSCLGCPYHSRRSWMEIAVEYPEEFEKICQMDDVLRSGHLTTLTGKPYMHQSGLPLRDAVAADLGQDAAQYWLDLDGFGAECEGHCGV